MWQLGPLMVNTELLCKGQWTLEITNNEEGLKVSNTAKQQKFNRFQMNS